VAQLGSRSRLQEGITMGRFSFFVLGFLGVFGIDAAAAADADLFKGKRV
jgi:hypothetical protein